eukprot:scaffold9264_cov15-Tisochrysis_lutea.AAC.1
MPQCRVKTLESILLSSIVLPQKGEKGKGKKNELKQVSSQLAAAAVQEAAGGLQGGWGGAGAISAAAAAVVQEMNTRRSAA